jgi:hypothetical protein
VRRSLLNRLTHKSDADRRGSFRRAAAAQLGWQAGKAPALQVTLPKNRGKREAMSEQPHPWLANAGSSGAFPGRKVAIGLLTNGSVLDRHPKGQCAHPLVRLLGPKVSVADHARRMEVAKGYRAPIEPIVVLVFALLDRFIRRPVQLHSIEECCSLESVARDVSRIEG